MLLFGPNLFGFNVKDSKTISRERYKRLFVVCLLLGLCALIGGVAFMPAELLPEIHAESFVLSHAPDYFEHAMVPILEPHHDTWRFHYDDLIENLSERPAVGCVDTASVNIAAISPKLVIDVNSLVCIKSTTTFSPTDPGNYQVLPLLV